MKLQDMRFEAGFDEEGKINFGFFMTFDNGDQLNTFLYEMKLFFEERNEQINKGTEQSIDITLNKLKEWKK